MVAGSDVATTVDEIPDLKAPVASPVLSPPDIQVTVGAVLVKELT